MKKRIFTCLLALCLLLAIPAHAAEDSTANFVRSKTYSGQFSDLAADSVFYGNVAALYEYGLSVGKPDGTFGLQDSVTVGQIVIFAGRIRSLYESGDPEASPDAYGGDGDSSEVSRYLRYLQAEGVLGTELDGSLSKPATRAQVAHVLANTLPEEALPSVHTDLVNQAYAARLAITDVTEYTPYYSDILALYRKGISIGSDETGSFLPNAFITRGAAAAMLTRMVDPALRVTPQWNLAGSHSARGTTLADLVEPGTYLSSPSTGEELEQTVRYMLSSGSNQMSLQFPSISAVQARKVMEEALSMVKSFCEQGYNSVSCSYNLAGTVTLTFSSMGLTAEETASCRNSALESAIAVHDQLWAEGLLTENMTETEKARVYYDWICENCVYDYSDDESPLSHIPYGLFAKGTAVCDGYTGAYNLFLKLEGIDCYALSNTGHIWTVASLDGTEVHIDTTWGDSGSRPSYAYFAMTPQESWREHPW